MAKNNNEIDLDKFAKQSGFSNFEEYNQGFNKFFYETFLPGVYTGNIKITPETLKTTAKFSEENHELVLKVLEQNNLPYKLIEDSMARIQSLAYKPDSDIKQYSDEFCEKARILLYKDLVQINLLINKTYTPVVNCTEAEFKLAGDLEHTDSET